MEEIFLDKEHKLTKEGKKILIKMAIINLFYLPIIWIKYKFGKRY